MRGGNEKRREEKIKDRRLFGRVEVLRRRR